ncbi:beta-1,3-galactosyltransferase 5-like [Amphibalanus amphitrite]|uniref:beta-1,3-galactosyltransferase 5-like n=1 Tax=Amphibalanus amphitrite TaxID=1232801 RepID=UPI001C9262E2|nr:beta-1,3-galactosyltransferase 5-like [Amphibalanus amphitrite]XP_043200735.1 beta-1,3-galactosyltransferase 5-like [Amphibalanus amphitrite]XP_043200736.1 beta-1,3-galactosyltransferase 5-like [Amphibalanus amphitrite]
MPTPRGWRRLLVALVGAAGLALLLLSRQLRPPEAPLPAAAGARTVLPYHDSFEYLLNSPVCGGEEPVRAVIVVHSDPRRPEVRQAIRDSLPAAELAQLGLRRAFMLAEASTRLREDEVTIAQSEIAKESALHGDVVQGNFHDSYHNLTYKHIMALDWAITFCPQARHIIKMDDDIVYNVYELVKVLHFVPSARYLGGNVFPAAAPYRGNSKWRVSRADWPRQYYPPYVSGWLYIASQDVARALVMQSTVVPFFWIDDVYVTGILAEQLHVTVRGLNRLFATSANCTRHETRQEGSGPSPSPAAAYLPSVVVAPSDRDLAALRAFNRLCRYCRGRPCGRRRRPAVCANGL